MKARSAKPAGLVAPPALDLAVFVEGLEAWDIHDRAHAFALVQMEAGGDMDQLKQIISRYRLSLYPESVTIDVAASERVVKAQEVAEVLKPGKVDLKTLLDTAALAG